MTMTDIDAFLKNEDAPTSNRLTAVENKAPSLSDAQAYLNRADAFARENPNEHLL